MAKMFGNFTHAGVRLVDNGENFWQFYTYMEVRPIDNSENVRQFYTHGSEIR